MPRLRRLAGAEIVRILGQFGFIVHSQRGSHIKLRRVLSDGTSQTLTVPAHPELDKAFGASEFPMRHGRGSCVLS